MKRFVVIGLGGFGSWAARLLFQEGYDVIAIDRNETLVDRFAKEVTKAVAGDATDPVLLREVGVEGADAAVVSTGGDLAASVLSILALKDVGVANIYVKVRDSRAAEALSRFDLTEMVFPEREAAERLVHRLSSTGILDYIPIGADFALEEIAIPDAWVGLTLRELSLPSRQGVQVVAVFDVLQGQWNPVPGPDHVLKESDIALVVGRKDFLEEVGGRRRGKRART